MYSSDLRVRVKATGLATYPDVTVICGPSERDPDSQSHVVNPTVLFEVLCPGTEDYDRGEKLEHYRQVGSLRAVVLVDPRSSHIVTWSRHGEAWTSHEYGSGEIIELSDIRCTLAVDAVLASGRGA